MTYLPSAYYLQLYESYDLIHLTNYKVNKSCGSDYFLEGCLPYMGNHVSMIV